MRIQVMAVCLALGVGSVAASAQAGATSGPAAGSVVTPAQAVQSELGVIESEMMGAVKVMPAEKYNFAPSAAIFAPGQTTEFATVRTFAQQVAHVAQANYFFYSAMSGQQLGPDVAAITKMTKKDDLVAALAASFAYGHKAIATLTPENAFQVVDIHEAGLQTRATLAQFAVSHANDHYGQMVEYLRMNGIVPPASAK